MNDETIFDAEVPPPERAPELSPANVFPWPPSADESAIDALGRTWVESVFHPSRFFAALPLEGNVGPAVLYAMIMGITGTGIRLFWSFILPAALDLQSMTPREQMTHPWAVVLGASHVTVVHFLLSPVYVLLGLVISAGIIQLVLMMLLRTRGPFERTFRMVCFTLSPIIFGIVPILGMLVGSFWALVVKIIGVREVHRTTTGRATATVLLPAGCLMLIVLIMLGIVVAVLGTGFMSKLPTQ